MTEDKLRDFFNKGRDWGRMKTNIPGVFVLKLPSSKYSPSRLAIEVNPADSSGNPTKKRGILIRSEEELEEFKKILTDEKLPKLQSLLDSINPEMEGGKRWKEEGVLEI